MVQILTYGPQKYRFVDNIRGSSDHFDNREYIWSIGMIILSAFRALWVFHKLQFYKNSILIRISFGKIHRSSCPSVQVPAIFLFRHLLLSIWIWHRQISSEITEILILNISFFSDCLSDQIQLSQYQAPLPIIIHKTITKTALVGFEHALQRQ